jgi:protein phosphatase
MIKLRTALLSDIGHVRRQNEDRVVADEEAGLFGVADGVGGLPGGAQAAQEAIDVIARGVRGASPGMAPDLDAILRRANDAVGELGRAINPIHGIGTTVTVGCVRDGNLRIAHVGDSRCYAWRDGQCTRMTEDHSVENEARLKRARGETVYFHPSQRQALTRCIGQPGPLEVDLIDQRLQIGDRYLFCTDGVTRLVSDLELGDVLATAWNDPAKAVRDIVGMAVRRGGPDNASAVVVVIDDA